MLETSATSDFSRLAVIPTLGDNTAIAKRCIEKGTVLTDIPGVVSPIQLRQTVLEGHRFTIKELCKGESLLSWGLPFGTTTVKIGVGVYVMNEVMRAALNGRFLSPKEAGIGHDSERNLVTEILGESEVNFVDIDVSPDSPFEIQTQKLGIRGSNASRRIQEASALESHHPSTRNRTFLGYSRLNGAVGTRNHAVVIGLTSLTSFFVRSVETHYRARKFSPGSSCDGVRVIAHTEGEATEQNNITCILRALCGWISHPNVGAVVLVTTGEEAHLSLKSLLEFAKANKGYQIENFQSPFLQQFTLDADRHASKTLLLEDLEPSICCAVSLCEQTKRTEQSLSKIRIALQCGGSDSFSGMNGNPLAGAVAERMRIRYGTSANLAESPELIGAEPYVLENVASEEVARAFIDTTERYKQYAAERGQSAAGNPSGGNLFRGLYNIVLKSLGAARKKPPVTTLDGVLEYGELMDPREEDIVQSLTDGDRESSSGVYMFMDSPGNDLESIAGQVATGCNIIFFITGNGAMTNFPFVPTLKIVTTSGRFKALSNEMDIDAGGFTNSSADGGGQEQENLIESVVDLVQATSAGQLSKGELAGHAQVSIWRNWSSLTSEEKAIVENQGHVSHNPIPNAGGVSTNKSVKSLIESNHTPAVIAAKGLQFRAESVSSNAYKVDAVKEIQTPPFIACIIPTSICSAEIGRMIANDFNSRNFLHLHWVSPIHTEGCGAAGGKIFDQAYQRLLLNFICHPSVVHGLFLEHGCEKTHNDYFKLALKDALSLTEENTALLERVGFVSIQKDGGIGSAKELVEKYFSEQNKRALSAPLRSLTPVSRRLNIGVMIHATARKQTETLTTEAAVAVSDLIHQLSMKFCADIVIPSNFKPLLIPAFVAKCLNEPPEGPTLRYAQRYVTSRTDESPGLQIMAPPYDGYENRMTWTEWITGMAGVCNVIVTICDPKSLKLLPGSILTPTVRVGWPSGTSKSDWETWITSSVSRCENHFTVLRDIHENGVGLKQSEDFKEYVSMINGEFVVPRGRAVSM